MLGRLAACKPNYAQSIKNAPLAIVVCSDPAKSDCFVEDAAVAATMMHIQATALGLGSCWVEVRHRYSADGEPSEVMVQEALGIPADIPVMCILSVGHPDETRRPVDPAKLMWEKVHVGKFRGDE